MAEIYLASSRGPEGFEKEVVIKRIRSFLASDPGFVQMFIAEARLASRLNHANLVQIFDFDKHEDTYYLAMEYVRGHSLWDVRRRAKEMMEQMRPTLVAHVGAEVARGLHHAHRLTDKGKPLNLVHRDVTPHNVLLSYDGAVKLTDFGVAKAGNHQTSAGVLKGKFAYMSPEQARGEPVDARTDVFALGIVLWEMLTGGRLFDGDSDVAVLRAVQQSAIAPPARLNPDVPADLDAVVMRALDRDPAARYQTAQELERALASFVLQHAKTLDDTDLGAYLRLLFAEELAGSEGAREGTITRTPVMAPPAEPAQAAGATVAMRKRSETPPREVAAPAPAPVAEPAPSPAPSPDEDAFANTHVVAPRARQVVIAEVPRPASVLPSTLTIGMRRALVTGLALFVVFGGVAVTIALRRPAASGTGTSATTLQQAPGSVTVPPQEAPRAATATPQGTPGAATASPAGTGAPSTGQEAQVAAPPPAEPVKAAEQGAREVARLVEANPAPGADEVKPAPAGDAPRSEPKASTSTDTPARKATRSANARTGGDTLPGTLQMTVTPWAFIYIDGTLHGEVSLRRSIKLRPGKHRIRAVHKVDGSDGNSITREADVVIEPGVTSRIEFRMLE